MNRREWRSAVEDVVQHSRDRQLTTIAAGLAFHALNALVPTLILVLVGLSAVGGLGYATSALSTLFGFESGALDSVKQLMTNASGGRIRASIVAGAIFLWSGGRLFEAVQDSFADVYGSEAYDSWSRKLLGIALTFGTILVGFVTMGVVGVWLSNLVEGLVWRVASPFLLLAALTVLFYPLYYLLPNVPLTYHEAVPGAIFAAVGWSLSAVGFRIYSTFSSSVQLYGALGGLVLFLTWVYLGSLVLLLGVILNAVVADRLDVTDESLDLMDAE